jgi:pyruvate kinase
MKKTKIICSIGPASCEPEVMAKMVNVGMNVARINFSHATLEERAGVVSTVKKVREMTGKNIAILYDTKGPEFRNGIVENNEITLVDGEVIRVVKETVVGNAERFSVNHPGALDSLEKGSVILLENGLMKIEVISKEEDGVTCKIINGGILGNKKSLNVPGIHLDIPFISEQDREDIIYACEHEGDFLALSFVSTKEDVLAVREILKEYNREDLKIISKIESTTGVENLASIIEVSDGIMVARGDLGVEVPMERLPIIQKMMVQECRKYGKFCIVATEMLESMKKNSRPTRAEVSDVANAVLDGADAVMLSGETTVGKFPVDTVRFMADICESTEEYYD